jgi:hypothetical protein
MWTTNTDLNFHAYSIEDRLIDSSGRIFLLPEKKGDEYIEINATGQSLPLEEFIELIKNHLAQSNQCCIAKIHLESYLEGMTLIEQTDT